MKSKMKKNLWFVAIACGLMTLCSCAKEVLNQEDAEETSPTSVLHVLTRTDEGGGDAQAQYIIVRALFCSYHNLYRKNILFFELQVYSLQFWHIFICFRFV